MRTHRSYVLLVSSLALLAPGHGVAELFTRGNQLLVSGSDDARSGEVVAAGDFNNDGFTDLVAGLPLAIVAGEHEAGEVQVRYGSANGLGTPTDFSEDADAIPENPGPDDHFGGALATGDFNDDGYADLAVGIPGEPVFAGSGFVADAGTVEIFYGGVSGLVVEGAEVWNQEDSGLPGAAEAGDAFGGALAAGDFDADGFVDLAIGSPGEDVGTTVDAGAVWILHGSASGLTATGSQLVTEATAGGTAQEQNQFGSVLATGDFDGDGHADFAVGMPEAFISSHINAGAVWVISGSDDTLDFPGTLLYQGAVLPSGTVFGSAEDNDRFGSALAAGDFDRATAASPRRQELAIGVPGEDGGTGAVEILAGTVNGVSALGSFVLRESDLAVTGVSRSFGAAVAGFNFHNGFRADLAVSGKYDDINAVAFTGRVFVIPGSSAGLVPAASASFTGGTAGLATGGLESFLGFGFALTGGNFDGRGFRDLVIGVPGLPPTIAGERLGGIQILYSALFASDFETHNLSQWSSATP